MQFHLSIQLGNDAMTDGDNVAHALRRVADRLRGRSAEYMDDSAYGNIMDENGNTVGSWRVLPDGISEAF